MSEREVFVHVDLEGVSHQVGRLWTASTKTVPNRDREGAAGLAIISQDLPELDRAKGNR